MLPWWVIVSVRSGTGAKTRLSTLPAATRAAIALAFAQDTLAAVAACGEVSGIIVVADELAHESLTGAALHRVEQGK